MGKVSTESRNCCVDQSAIKRIRKEKNLLLQDVAALTGIPRASIWKMESYDYGIKICDLVNVANALGVPLSELLVKSEKQIESDPTINE